MRSISTITRAMILLGAVALFGCIPAPKGNLIWSPDGQTALLLDGHSLRFCDATGALLGGSLDEVVIAEWAGNAEQLLVVRRHALHHWSRLTPLLPEAQRAAAAERAQRVKAHLLDQVDDVDELLAARGKQLRSHVGLPDDVPTGDAALALLVLFGADDAELAAKFGDTWRQPKDLAAEVSLVQVVRRGDEGVEVVRTVFASTRPVESVRVTSDAATAAVVVQGDGRDGRIALYATTLAEPGHVLVAESVNRAPEWTNDQSALMYTAPATPDGAPSAGALGVLFQRTVRDAQGALLDEMPEAEARAVVFFEQTQMLRTVPGAPVFVALKDVHVPALPDDAIRGEHVYAFVGGERPSLQAIDNEALATHMPDGIAAISVSPGGDLIALVDMKGRVCLLTRDGALIVVQPDVVAAHSITQPSWRSDRAMSLVLPAGHPAGRDDRHTVAIWTVPPDTATYAPGAVHTAGEGDAAARFTPISHDWPAGVGDSFLSIRQQKAHADVSEGRH